MNNIRLSELRRGQSAFVSALSADGSARRRFQDIGLIQGTSVECLGRSPLGSPCAYLIRGAVIALRDEDAECISVTAEETAPARLTSIAPRPSEMPAI